MTMDSEDNLITLSHVSFSYSSKGKRRPQPGEAVLRDISLTIKRGQRVAILGRNGEGKSTLLQILAGIIKPGSGTVRASPHLTVSLLALGVGFSPDLTGADNVILSAILFGRSKQWAREYTMAIRDFSELGALFDRPVRTYSAGMKARLAFSIAMNLNIDLLLVDEVLAVGDVDFRRKCADAVRNKIRDGQTLVLVSHSVSDVRDLCDTAIWLDRGLIRDQGSPTDVLDAYVSSI